MAAPSVAFTTISGTAVAPDAPVDSTLMTALKDNTVHNNEVLYDSSIHTAIKAHNHDGKNSSAVAGASGGIGMAFGAHHGNGRQHGLALCAFAPQVAIFCDADQAGDISIMHDADAADVATPWTTGGTKTATGLNELRAGGGQVLATGMGVAHVLTCLALFKSLGSIVKIGEYAGNGSSQSISLGFQARAVLVWRKSTNDNGVIRTASMSGANSKEFDGTNGTTMITALGSTSFSVGAHASVNSNLVDYMYIAFKDGSEQGESIAYTSYTGDAAASKEIANPDSFAPQFALVCDATTNARAPFIAFREMGGYSKRGGSTTLQTNGILEFTEDSIFVGNTSQLNTAGATVDVLMFRGGTRP